MKLETIKLLVQIVSTMATSAGVLISLHYSRTKSRSKYSFFCKLTNQEKRVLGQDDYRKMEFGVISANEFNIGIQQVGIEFISNPFKFKKPIYIDSKSFDENSGEISKARKIYSRRANAYFGLKEFNDRWDKKMFVRPYIIDMSGRLIKINWFKMLNHRFRVNEFAYKGIPNNYFKLL